MSGFWFPDGSKDRPYTVKTGFGTLPNIQKKIFPFAEMTYPALTRNVVSATESEPVIT